MTTHYHNFFLSILNLCGSQEELPCFLPRKNLKNSGMAKPLKATHKNKIFICWLPNFQLVLSKIKVTALSSSMIFRFNRAISACGKESSAKNLCSRLNDESIFALPAKCLAIFDSWTLRQSRRAIIIKDAVLILARLSVRLLRRVFVIFFINP